MLLVVPVAVAFLAAFFLRNRVSRRLALFFGIFAAANLVAAIAFVVFFEWDVAPQALSDPFGLLFLVTLLLIVGFCSLPFYVIPIRNYRKPR